MVIMVHGFAGSLQDLRLVRAHMRLAAPGRGLHSFPFTLDLSLLYPFPLNLSSLCLSNKSA
jgi:hypothetical protein